MNPTVERELKLDIDIKHVDRVIDIIPDICGEMNWDSSGRIMMVNHDRYFDRLLESGNFLLHSKKSYVRVRKSVWPEKMRQAEFIAYRKLTEAVYGKPAEIYDNEISVLKTQEITNELVKDCPEYLRKPSDESIGAVEHLESMGLSEIIRVRCHRYVWPVRLGSGTNDMVKVKVDKVAYKTLKEGPFAQFELDYYSPQLFDEATRFLSLLAKKMGEAVAPSSISKLDRGLKYI